MRDASLQADQFFSSQSIEYVQGLTYDKAEVCFLYKQLGQHQIRQPISFIQDQKFISNKMKN